MFKHILIPTDGSPIAVKAAKSGIRFASEIGAKVTAYYALEEFQHSRAALSSYVSPTCITPPAAGSQ